MLKCPNCNKQLKWVPKGKHTCLCGEIIETDGKDLEAVGISITDIAFRGNVRKAAGIKPGFAIFSAISVLVCLSLRVYYHQPILQFEAYLMFKVFRIDPESYTQSILPFIASAIIILWFAFKSLRTVKN